MTEPTHQALVADAKAPPRFFHIYATADGESHLVQRDVAAQGTLLPLQGLSAMSYAPSNATWHVTPRRQFVINLTGELDAEVSDGTKQRIGPGDLVFLEDTIGKGHATQLLGPVTCLFIVVADDFDVGAWTGPAGSGS